MNPINFHWSNVNKNEMILKISLDTDSFEQNKLGEWKVNNTCRVMVRGK